MTINDMLEAGICVQGLIEVESIEIDAHGNASCYLWFSNFDEWNGTLDDGWANQEIKYVYGNDEGATVFEVEPPECTR